MNGEHPVDRIGTRRPHAAFPPGDPSTLRATPNTTMQKTLKLALALAAAAALPACSGSSTAPDPNRGSDSFSANTLPSYAAYSDGSQNWTVTGGELVGTGPANQSVLVRPEVGFADGWVEAVSPRADDGGLVLRFASPTNYYLLAFRDDSAESPRDFDNLAVYHHSGGAYNQMWTRNVAWPRGTPHTIRFEAAGATLRVYFDGQLQGEMTPGPTINDPDPYLGSGAAGVRHFGFNAGWVTRFSDFTWHGMDAER